MRANLRYVALLATVFAAGARAQALLDTAATLGKKPDALTFTFTVANAGNYRLTVTDLAANGGIGPRLGRIDAGVARGSTLVTSASVVASNATGQTVKNFTAAAGEHRLLLIGQPNLPSTVGSAGVQIDDPVSGAILLQEVQPFSLPPPAKISPADFEHEVSTPVAGSYVVDIRDFQLPVGMSQLQGLIIRRSDTQTFPFNGSAQVTVPTSGPDVLEIFVHAVLPTDVSQGLVGLNVSDANGSTLASAVDELGEWPFKYPFSAPSATASLSVADLQFPRPLASVGAVVVRDGRLVARQIGSGTTGASGAVGDYVAYAAATAAAGSPKAGSFGVVVGDAAQTPLLQIVQNVVPPAPATDVGALDDGFDIATGGDYTLTLTDFGQTGFFDAFTSIQLALTRDTTIVKTLDSAGSFVFTATPGRYSLAVIADPAGSAGAGLFGVRVQGGTGNSVVYERTQAVGAAFISAEVDTTTSQSVDVTLTDLAFPADFDAIKVAVTRGSDRAGEITGAGTFSFSATPGKYFVNLLATPDAALGYSTFGLNVRVTPPAPTVMLGSSASSVAPGGSVTLTWTSTDASGCSASGGWTGSRGTSGSELVGPLNASTTFKLSCTGGGGSADASTSVSITGTQRPPGGGGAFDWLGLIGLGILVCVVRAKPLRGASRGSLAGSAAGTMP